MIFVTGGAGFIGSNFILNWFKYSDEPVLNIDKLTYAGNINNLIELRSTNYHFSNADIIDFCKISELFNKYKPRAILNFAAESHVDRSIVNSKEFINTNIIGTYNLLECSRAYFDQMSEIEKLRFRFLHISTDEVFGSLDAQSPAFSEKTAYAPNSPYSATKAASDHLVRAYFHTYRLPTLTTNCSNNFGPFQYPEKLIPMVIYNCLKRVPIPIYGDGLNKRDWLYVIDHCNALMKVLACGKPGETYNIGGCCEKTNLDVVNMICQNLDQMRPRSDGKSYLELNKFVKDRMGHDRRYAVDTSKIERELEWKPEENFFSGLKKTINWYLTHEVWIDDVLKKDQK